VHGRKRNQEYLPSLFPWTKQKEGRRQLVRKVPLQSVNSQQNEFLSSAMETNTTTNCTTAPSFEVITEKENTVDSDSSKRSFVEQGTQSCVDKLTFKDQGTQTELFDIKKLRVSLLNAS